MKQALVLVVTALAGVLGWRRRQARREEAYLWQEAAVPPDLR